MTMTRFRVAVCSLGLSALLMTSSAMILSSAPAQATRFSLAPAPVIKAAPTQMLVTATGMSLYVYTADKKNQSTCSGDCATAWPPLLLPAGTTARPRLPGFTGTFGVAHRSDGTNQLTYDGAPLYSWFKDKKPGDVTGQGIGGVWWAAVAPTPGGAPAVSSLIKTAPAQMLVTGTGMTLYAYAADKKNVSTCTGECAIAWPPLELASGAVAPASIDGIGGTLAVAAREDGSKQLTYDGAPLYTWFKDEQPGDMTGQGIAGVWWIVVVPSNTSGSTLVKTAPARQLVTAGGVSLYVFAADKKNQSTCTGACATAWPPLLIPTGTTPPATVSGIAGTFGVAPRAGGSKQLTFDGAPLYTWSKDTKPGDMTGQGVGGVWWAAAGPAASGTTATSSLVKTVPAQALVTPSGITLYVFAADKKNQSTCTGGCATAWPPLELKAGTTAPTSTQGVSGVFALATRADGSKQLTFDGAPLYTWFKDKKAGDMTGQGVGGTWWIVLAPPASRQTALTAATPRPSATPQPSATTAPLPTSTTVPALPATAVPSTSTPVPQPSSTPVSPTNTPVPQPSNTPAPLPMQAVQISIQSYAFSQPALTIPVGTTVVWTNKDSVAHTVTSDTGAWPDSGMLATNATYSYTFMTAGTYTYHCAVHASMRATITVTAPAY